MGVGPQFPLLRRALIDFNWLDAVLDIESGELLVLLPWLSDTASWSCDDFYLYPSLCVSQKVCVFNTHKVKSQKWVGPQFSLAAKVKKARTHRPKSDSRSFDIECWELQVLLQWLSDTPRGPATIYIYLFWRFNPSLFVCVSVWFKNTCERAKTQTFDFLTFGLELLRKMPVRRIGLTAFKTLGVASCLVVAGWLFDTASWSCDYLTFCQPIPFVLWWEVRTTCVSGPKFALLRNALVDRHRLEGVEHIECGELLEYITTLFSWQL